MADILIKHLKAKAEEHSALATLLNQWGYDEKIIPKALQTVGNLFPHYSRHDESHCKQILINIERLLGDNIKLLTATDTWLLLEAAYWHDIGMVVPADALKDALNNPAFETYLDSIRNSPNHELHRFALTFDAKDLTKCFSGADTPLDALDKFRQLMAEWFRQSHATRSNAIVQDPWATVGISSPRTELIPARLFRLLGNICQMHGVPFSDLISNTKGLPFREAGMAQEDCHPRFVACLLRMGDLLDMDDNRFCPVMQRIAGENRPHLSKAHEHKHAAIRHLRMDRERIEVSAECENIDGYIETFKWFDWLKQEMQDQMSHWQDIVPSRELGLLPTLGEISVRLAGEYQLLKAGERPQFTVDTAKAFELLQGSNLYNTKFACIRELLQNAIDATLLRIWLTKRDVLPSWAFNQENYESFQKEFADWGVKVNLVETGVPASDDAGKSFWRIHIKDKGTGISRTDLAHMSRVGGSQRNTERQSLIKSMPEWIKPSGAFGIGLQSVFMVTDKITIITKSIFTNEQLKITMHSPTGVNEGMVTIKTIPFDVSFDYGTEIKFEVEIENSSKNWSLDRRKATQMHFISQFDPVLNDYFPKDAAELADRIINFSQKSILPIEGVLIDGYECNYHFGKSKLFDASRDQSLNYIELNGHNIIFYYELNRSSFGPPNFHISFKGQPFKFNAIKIPNINIELDLMSGKASEWLNASRDSIASDAKEKLGELILEVLKIAVERDIEKNEAIFKDPLFSLFLSKMAIKYESHWRDFAIKSNDAWLDLVEIWGGNTFREYFEKNEFFACFHSYRYDYSKNFSSSLIEIEDKDFIQILWRAWGKESCNNISIVDRKDIGLNEVDEYISIREFNLHFSINLFYKFSKSEKNLYTDRALARALIEGLDPMNCSRYLLPCRGEYWEELYLKPETALRVEMLYPHSIGLNCNYLLLPFLYNGFKGSIECTNHQLDQICNFIQPHLIKQLSLEEIKKAYKNLIEYIDGNLMKKTGNSRHWTKLRQKKIE
ncbi:HD domain-containing protein [Undibacterium squillarum]|uniref:HD-CE domain-containing protein n=1 Tax=Undibacterium squillarum TaxID=1131567 RepID=A0ABQ2XQ65_9BURK|nr:ATP-binding protein [Undibacterium squillarum]GGX28870.1 hypothetical protein GCM10010946_02070 [Undibacterium squillarum]